MAGDAPAVTGRPDRAVSRPYTPSRQSPQALAERTVGREEVLDALHRRLVVAATSRNRGHTLIVGPRGSGKTHLIEVALHRLDADPKCRARLVIGRVDEDAVGIVSYADLLVDLLGSLGVVDRAEARRDVAALEAALLDHLDGRVLVAVVENLARLFESMGTPGQRDLRSFVENTGQVVLLASTPLLFRSVGSRNEPWFGSFAIEHLAELNLDEGSELLRRLAAEDGQDRLVEFIATPRGQGRLAALHHLAGGSPRLWTIFAGCASVERLDDLVPAVEELLENLVPYYQQRLWELPGNEARLVRELGTGPPSASVADLAARCGLEERTVATALGRLADACWVRGEKVPGTDQRRTWYRLREPLLRHHFQYRRADGEPLRLIVDILRAWFDPSERRSHLAGVRPASVAERHLLATMSFDPPQRSDGSYAARSVDDLVAEARSWMVDPDALGTPDAGVLVDAVVIAVCSSPTAARDALAARGASPAVRAAAEQVLAVVERQAPELSVVDRVGRGLDAASSAFRDRPDWRVLELVATCWNGENDPTAAADRLSLQIDASVGRLSLTIRDELGYWLGRSGRHDEALAAFVAVADDRTRTLGPDHPDTLLTRHNIAYQLGALGRHDEALAALAAVADDCTRTLGPDHPRTLVTRHNLAHELDQLNRYSEALVAFAAVAEDRSRVLGPDHPRTRATRSELRRVALELIRTGEPLSPAEALGAFASTADGQLLRDLEAARDGSAEAELLLPPELRSLVAELRLGKQRRWRRRKS